MRVLGLIPARGGSRRVERKNLAEVGGRTLVRRALDTALQSGCLDAVALSSDDPQILAQADGLDGVARIERPAELAGDDALAIDVVRHALETLGERYDAVALIQATSPFTLPEDVCGCVELLERTGAGSAVTVARAEHAAHPLKLKLLDGDRLTPWIEDDRMAPAGDLPELWARNGSVYVATLATIEAGSLASDDVRGHPMPRERSVDVNDPLDLEFARFLAARGEG
jgi:CMP-N-acetylneuraminic acid synthetase